MLATPTGTALTGDTPRAAHPPSRNLAHTQHPPVHWLATATALAGVVAAAGLLQPDRRHRRPARPRSPKTAPGRRGAAPTRPASTSRSTAGPTEAAVQQQASGDLDGDGRPETVAVVRCDAGIRHPAQRRLRPHPGRGRPAGPESSPPCVDPKDRLSVDRLHRPRRRVTATLLGYSSPDVPSCCPDVNAARQVAVEERRVRPLDSAEAHSV